MNYFEEKKVKKTKKKKKIEKKIEKNPAEIHQLDDSDIAP
jgi:hypothetical protein